MDRGEPPKAPFKSLADGVPSEDLPLVASHFQMVSALEELESEKEALKFLVARMRTLFNACHPSTDLKAMAKLYVEGYGNVPRNKQTPCHAGWDRCELLQAHLLQNLWLLVSGVCNGQQAIDAIKGRE